MPQNTFHPGVAARDAARQIGIQARAGVLTGAELDRLLKKVEHGIAFMLDDEEEAVAQPAPAVPETVRPASKLTLLDGGRS